MNRALHLLLFALVFLPAIAVASDLPAGAAFFLSDVSEPAASMKLDSLLKSDRPHGEREVRVWIGFGLLSPEKMIRFKVDKSGSRTGLVYLHYPSSWRSGVDEQIDSTRQSIIGKCEKVGTHGETESCLRAELQSRTVDTIYEALVALGLWDMPDQWLVPEARNSVRDGVTMLVELRDGDSYRAYHWSNPSFSKGKQAENALSMLNLLKNL